MSVSVEWLVQQRDLGLTIVAGEQGLHRAMLWAHSIELEDPVPWLRGGELLLTTGLHLPPSAAARRRYVQSLERAGVAAVGFGVGLSFPRVPDEILQAADRAGLPVLEVPLSTPFIAVTKAVMERIAEQHYEGVARASRIQARMTRAALRGGTGAVLRELASATDTQALIVDVTGTVGAAYPAAAADLVPEVLDDLPGSDDPTAAASAASAGPRGVVSAQAIRVHRRVHGRVVLVGERSLDPADHLVLGHAVSLIALDEEKPLRVRESQNRVNSLLLSLLVDGRVESDAAAEYLEAADFPVAGGAAVLALWGAHPQRLLALVEEVLSEWGNARFGVSRGEYAVVLLPRADAERASALVSGVASQAGHALRCGLAHSPSVGDLAGAWRRAVTAAEVARSRRAELVDFCSLAGGVLLAHPDTHAVLAGLAESRVRPLMDSDRKAGTELVETLRAFLEHNGHWEPASSAVGVHRHTLRSRIERIQDLLGVDLASAHVRAELLLALTAEHVGG